jgi:hypothetical protein
MKSLPLGLAAIFAMGLTGCASIIDGGDQSLSFSSNPEGATVYLNGTAIGKTPVTISAKRQSSSQHLRFTKEGYKDADVQAASTMNPWFLGNIITGGVLGSTTDGLSGAAFEYEQSSYMVTLLPASASALSDKTVLTDKQKVVSFIVSGYQNLIKELGTPGSLHLAVTVQGSVTRNVFVVDAQDGPYLGSLLALANVSDDQKANMKKRLQSLSQEYTEIPEFADKAADMLLAKS